MDRFSSYNRKYSLAGYLLLLVLFLPPFVLLILNGYETVPALVTDMAFRHQEPAAQPPGILILLPAGPDGHVL